MRPGNLVTTSMRCRDWRTCCSRLLLTIIFFFTISVNPKCAVCCDETSLRSTRAPNTRYGSLGAPDMRSSAMTPKYACSRPRIVSGLPAVPNSAFSLAKTPYPAASSYPHVPLRRKSSGGMKSYSTAYPSRVIRAFSNLLRTAQPCAVSIQASCSTSPGRTPPQRPSPQAPEKRPGYAVQSIPRTSPRPGGWHPYSAAVER